MTAFAPATAPIPCPVCGKRWSEGMVDAVEQVEPNHYHIYLDCTGCGTRLRLFLGALDEGGVGLTHFVVA